MNLPLRKEAGDAPPPGFADPVLDSQTTFRAVLDAMARPGTIVAVPATLPEVPEPLFPASAAVCLALADFDTPLWLDPSFTAAPAVGNLLRFHCGCPLVEQPLQATFAVIGAAPDMPPLDAFAQGSDEYPDRSATLIVQVATLSDEHGVTLSGPGIRHVRALNAGPLPESFWPQVQANSARFPRGVDIVLASGQKLAALPRSTRVEI